MILTPRTPAAPVPTVETEAYWAAAREGRLMFGHCDACDQPHFYPRARCPFCLSARTRLVQARGTGTLYSYSVMRRAAQPYAIAYVTLDEGQTMMTNLVGCAPEHIRIGMAVRVVFVPSEGGAPVPMFEPVP
jgi:uncharacterized OB-fold protein